MWSVILVLAGFSIQACTCADGSYYVVEMPEASNDKVTKAQPKHDFKVYWNVPTMQCKSKKVPFDHLSRFGIIQNEDDNFRQGDKMTILYDPGFFPAMFNSSPGVVRYRNGGVPQAGNLQKHLEAFNTDVDETIPNKDYNGIAVIDFESWKPIFLQNYGTLKPYIDVSYDLERKLHWWWPQDWIKTTAQDKYERAAKNFMDSTLKLAKQLRPNATWGYYAFPYCYNRGVAECSSKTMKENDRLDWLWDGSTGVFPSVYTNVAYTGAQLQRTASGAVAEAARVAPRAAVLPYISYVYRDNRSTYYKESDLEVLLDTIYNSKARGVVVWGSSKDVDTKEKCELLLNFVTKTFGPMIAQFTNGDRHRVAIAPTPATSVNTTSVSSTENVTQTSEIIITTENTTLTNKPITELPIETLSQPSQQFNTTQNVENGNDMLETANKVKEISSSDELILNSVIQFFDTTETNNNFTDNIEQNVFTPNPDDTPGFTQSENELEVIPETNIFPVNNESNISIKRKNVVPPILLPFSNSSINWKNFIKTTPTTESTKFTTTTELVTENNTETVSDYLTTSTVSLINKEYSYNKTSQESESDKTNNVTDNESLESLTQLAGSLHENSTTEPTSTTKYFNEDEELVNASKLLQDLTDESREVDNLKFKDDNNQPNDLRQFYDFASIDDTLDSSQDIKNKYGQEIFEDDTILEAVAEILNSTDAHRIDGNS